MDIKSVRIPGLFGLSIGFFDPMNGGKTEALISELNRAGYYNYNAIAYNHALNTRERDAIVIDGEKPFRAKTVISVDDIKDDLQQRILANQNLTFSPDQRGKWITVEGIPQQAGYPLRVVGIDEANLFTLTPSDAQKMIHFLDWSREEGLAVYLSGLKYDFRHLPFGYIHSILPYIDIQISKKPACMAIRDNGEECNNPANHTQRVWSTEFAREQSLDQYFASEPAFDFVDKDGTHFFNRYVPAPFFDRTLRIEESKDGRIKYLPVCNDCTRVPFKQETFGIYNTLVQGDHSFGFLGQSELTNAIQDFLVGEGWVERTEEGLLVPVPYYRHQVGGYAPK
ncbi:hypothetical protein HY495_01215 [Candidatus Woesearchaeota archaeon]|nr:hypothetical protein [Candidatus Woesearchaeota archaeon]